MTSTGKDTVESLRAEVRRLNGRIIELEASVAARAWSNPSVRDDLLENIFSMPHILIAYLDRDLNFIRVNETYARADGKEPSYFPGKGHFELFPNEENEMIFRKVVETGEPHSTLARPFEYALNPERGVTYWDWTLTPVRDREGAVTGALLMLLDVTLRIRKEEELQMYKVLFDNIDDIAYICDTDGRIVYVNRAFEEIAGRKVEDFIGAPFDPLFDPPDIEVAKSHFERVVRDGEAVSAELTMKETGRVCEYKALPLRDSSGRTIGVIGIGRDVTDRRRMDQETQKRERLESLGLLAGGLAHDFNNMLTGVLGNLSVVLYTASLDDRTKEILEASEKAALMAKGLTRQLLTFSRGGSPVKEAASVAELLDECCRFSLRGSNVFCRLDIPTDLWSAEIDTGQIGQVLNNIVINAKQAMPGGGVVEVAAQNVELAPNDARPPGLAPGRYVLLTIFDEGSGIPREQMSKIFDPFFTTKRDGSGLGLAVAYSIVNSHGGCLTVDSEPGEGTTFRIYLPATFNEPSAPEKAPGRRPECVRPLRLLVMDDDKVIREALDGILSILGHKGDFAAEGAEALDMFLKAKEDGAAYDAVIMDLTVPGGMGGRKAVTWLRELDPDVKVIVSSGYSDDDVLARYESYGFSGVMAKPFSLEDVAGVLDRVVGCAGPGPGGSRSEPPR